MKTKIPSLKDVENLFNSLVLLPKTAQKRVSLRGECERLFRDYGSPYYRKLDAIARGDGEVVRCCTCIRVHDWREMDAGHYIPKRYLDAYFADKNINAQCRICNGIMEGNRKIYSRFIDFKYGKKTLERLNAIPNQPSTLTRERLKELEEMFITNLKAWNVLK